MRQIATICVTVLIFPPFEAAMMIPSEAATMRTPDTINSRETIITTIHAGRRWSSTKDMSAATTSILSANGSINFPKLVTMPRLRAIYPSAASVKEAIIKTMPASKSPSEIPNT